MSDSPGNPERAPINEPLSTEDRLARLEVMFEQQVVLINETLGAAVEIMGRVAEVLERMEAVPAPETPATAPAAPREKGFLRRGIERVRPARVGIVLAGVLAVGAAIMPGGTGNLESARADGSPSGSQGLLPQSSTSNGGSSTTISTQEQARRKMVVYAESADTVSVAVSRMGNIQGLPDNAETTKHNIFTILHEEHHQKLNHRGGAMSSLEAKFKHVGEERAAYGIAFSVASSEANRAKVYNAIRGNNNEEKLPEGVTPEQALHAIGEFLTNPNNKFAIEHPTGTFGDNGQRGENVFPTPNDIHLDGSQAVFTVTRPDGSKVYFLVTNDPEAINDLCLNVIFLKASAPAQTETVTPSSPAPSTTSPTTKPRRPHHGNSNTTNTRRPHHGQPVNIVHPPHHTPKTDTNTTPAGVPGENGGTGTTTPTTGPGIGPAGQKPDANGFVPGEASPPNTSPTTTTPAPVETTTTPTPPSTPEQGHDDGSSQPPEDSSGSGTTHSGDQGPPQS